MENKRVSIEKFSLSFTHLRQFDPTSRSRWDKCQACILQKSRKVSSHFLLNSSVGCKRHRQRSILDYNGKMKSVLRLGNDQVKLSFCFPENFTLISRH
jgi:hypothetical protein